MTARSTTTLGFTNLTDKTKITLKPAASTSDAGCDLTLDKSELPAAEHTSVTVTVPAGCKVADDGIDFKVTATGGAASPAVFPITAAPKPDASKPNWSELWAFPIALGALLVGAVVFFIFWRKDDSSPSAPLKYLKDTWSFSDSWVTNVTVAGGLLTGIFGSSDVVTAFLGKDGKSAVALATVGAAVAVAFVGAGPIVLLATKTKDGDFVSVGGLLAACAVTLAGAYGELWVVFRSGQTLDLDGWEGKIGVVALAAAVLLTVYAIRSTRATLDVGSTPPPPPTTPPPSDTIVAARMIVEALKAQPNVDEVAITKAVEAVAAEYPPSGTSPGDDYPPPRRSALM